MEVGLDVQENAVETNLFSITGDLSRTLGVSHTTISIGQARLVMAKWAGPLSLLFQLAMAVLIWDPSLAESIPWRKREADESTGGSLYSRNTWERQPKVLSEK
ncbi:hypothetical protein OESDEN_12169 [Oesophagostomum dentatum]|uniref:Uncharacterized protein n=1 Tax=Oesophagostomum dentatum TaxID=61180 RepID=A0A0B1SSW2_OESDE|nr:hypothetical protein OESDEN_12169 [Oesophagostomum dentatum]